MKYPCFSLKKNKVITYLGVLNDIIIWEMYVYVCVCVCVCVCVYIYMYIYEREIDVLQKTVL